MKDLFGLTASRRRSMHSPLFGDSDLDRVYFTLPDTEDTSFFCVKSQIESTLIENGYSIQDYKKGYAVKIKEEKAGVIRIGKLLNKLRSQEGILKGTRKKYDSLLKAYENDVSRKKEDYLVVVSRNPVDIARMSTGTPWDTCMRYKRDRIDFHHYVPAEVRVGTLVAYLISKKDIDINRPIARDLLIPYFNLWGNFAFGPGRRSAGAQTDCLKQALNAICETVLNRGKSGSYRINRKSYHNGAPHYISLRKT